MSSVLNSDARLHEVLEALLTPRRRATQPGLDYEQRGSVELSGGPVAYWSSGTGPPVLLVHGWEGTHADLDAFAPALLARGARVVALDFPAHGESAGTQAGITDFADAILALDAIVGPLAGVIAHSVGCPSTGVAIERGLRPGRAAFLATPTRYERWAREFAGAAGVDGDALVALLVARGIDVPSLDLCRTAATFELPGLVVHATDDRVCDVRGGRAVAGAWRGSEFLEVDGLGHARILRDPAVVERVVGFIASDPSFTV